MRFGCSGCLSLVVALAIAGLVVGGTLGAGVRMLAHPPSAPPSSGTDGPRAQQKLFELSRSARRGASVVLSEAELNALLARHVVGGRNLALTNPHVTLTGNDRLVLDAQCPARRLLDEAALAAVADLLPQTWQARPLWLHIGLRLRVETDGGRRQVRLDAEEFAVGRQRLPASLVRLLLDPATVGLTQWTLPDHLDRIAIEPGRLVFHPLNPR